MSRPSADVAPENHVHTDESQITAERPLLVQKRLTCLQAAQIWSISFSRLVQRAARNAAVLPGVGSTALPGAPEEQRVV